MIMTTHEWTVMGMYLFISLFFGGYTMYAVYSSKHNRRRRHHAR